MNKQQNVPLELETPSFAPEVTVTPGRRIQLFGEMKDKLGIKGKLTDEEASKGTTLIRTWGGAKFAL